MTSLEDETIEPHRSSIILAIPAKFVTPLSPRTNFSMRTCVGDVC